MQDVNENRRAHLKTLIADADDASLIDVFRAVAQIKAANGEDVKKMIEYLDELSSQANLSPPSQY